MNDPKPDDELAGTEQPFVAHLIELRERLSALQALAAVDQLILAGAGLETVVEALLDRMQPTLRGDVTCIALPSAAVPGASPLSLVSDIMRGASWSSRQACLPG